MATSANPPAMFSAKIVIISRASRWLWSAGRAISCGWSFAAKSAKAPEHELFGNMSVIATGDFLQLPPVKKMSLAFPLEEFEDANTGVEVRKKINAKVLRVENYFWTMHAHQSSESNNGGRNDNAVHEAARCSIAPRHVR